MSRYFDKFWQVSAADDTDKLIFGPLAIRYDWTRTADTQPGELTLEIANVNTEHRAFIERKGVNIEMDLGYKDYHGLVFKGAVEFGTSEKDSGTRWTKLVLKDGAIHWRNIFIAKSFPAGTDRAQVITELFNKLTGLPEHIQSQFQHVNQALQGQKDIVPVLLHPKQPGQTRRTRTRSTDSIPVQVAKAKQQIARRRASQQEIKNARAELVRGAALSKLDIFCNSFGLSPIWDLQTLHIVPDEVALPMEAPAIAPGHGLLSSPRKISFGKVNRFTTETGWEFDCHATHELQPGGLVWLESEAFTGTLLISRLEGHGASHDGGEWRNKVQGIEYVDPSE
jgi:hypothetical protein